MSASKPVVVYGASGFSGRLVVEYLREYNIPFIAAGRNLAKIEQVMKLVPGIETADYEVAEVGNSVDELAKLFSGAKVVCNTVGPFIYTGPRVIEACLKIRLPLSGHQRRTSVDPSSRGEMERRFRAARIARGSCHRLHVCSKRRGRAHLFGKHHDRHARNPDDVPGNSHIRVDANHFCGTADRSAFSGAESVQTLAAGDRAGSCCARADSDAIGSGMGRVPPPRVGSRTTRKSPT